MLLVNLSQDKSKLNPYISNTLLKNIKKNLEENKKVILYINKRGDFSSLICDDCNYLYKCKNCDISLSIHKYPERLICHLCGENKNIPIKCDKCNKTKLKKVGVGTQQIEDNLKKDFVNTNIFRFDSDSVKNKSDKSGALEKLENAQIIIGTKMITTGFDFNGVGLIGIILLEQELMIPKYNTEEKIVSNIKQLIGRGGRKGEKTEIIIQTFIPENEIIKNITENNYKDFFVQTLEERKLFNYPPFTEMITLEYRDKNKEKALNFVINLKNKLDINNKTNIEIKLNSQAFKKYNQFYYKIIIKGNNPRKFLECIKPEIMRNSGLAVIFE